MKSPTQVKEQPSDRTWNFVGIVVINIALPIIIYNYMKSYTSEIYAVALSGVPPMMKTIYEIVVHERKDFVSFMQIFSMIFSVILLALTTDPKLLMAKDSCTTIFMGIMHFVSLTWEENLFFVIRRQISHKTKEEMDSQWARPVVRETSRYLCIVWGVFMITDACFRILLIYTLSVQTMIIISPIIGITCMLTMGYWSYNYICTHEVEDEASKPLLSSPNTLQASTVKVDVVV